MKRDSKAIAWAAGLFEGEGCLTIHEHGFARRRRTKPVDVVRGKYSGHIKGSLSTTDEDVIRRFQAVVGFGRVNGPYVRTDRTLSRFPNAKPIWTWFVSGFERTQAIVALLWPWLGTRRHARAREVLTWARLHMFSHAHCRRGHVWTEANTYRDPTGKRTCKACRRISDNKRHGRERGL